MKLRLLSFITALSCVAAALAAQAPKYIFYFIGDGMGMAQSLSGQLYMRTVRGDSTPLTMFSFPVASMCTTHSASSPVTDSAAAGTALATGSKTRNGMLGMTPDSVAVTSIAKELYDRGYGIALVTTVPIDDATPGAFYAHVPDRGMYYQIGRQMAASGYHFLAGSKLRGLTDKAGNPTDLPELFAANGYGIARGVEQVDSVTEAVKATGKVLLLNPERYRDNHQAGFTIDSLPGALTLPDMTLAAIDNMKRGGHERFFMMIEGGNIDYAGHANDAGTIVKEVINFNQALRHAYDFYLEHPDETLIVVTADHETGGMGLGNNTVGYDMRLRYIDSQRISKDSLADYCRSVRKSRRIYEWEDMQDFLRNMLGFWGSVPVTEEQTARLREEFDKSFKSEFPKDKKTLYNSFNTFTEEVYRVMDSVTGFGFTTNGHSGGLVPVYAVGVGAEEFIPAADNIDIPARIRRIAGI